MRTGHPAAEPPPAGAVAAAGLNTQAPAGEAISRWLAGLVVRFDDAARRLRVGDEHALHDTRVAARRLEAALAAWRDSLDVAGRRRARRSLRRWRRRLSTARDLEVLVASVSEPRLASGPAEAMLLAALGGSLKRRRDRERQRLLARLTPVRLERMRERLDHLVAGVVAGPDAIELAMLRAARAESGAASALARARASDDDDALHTARIAVKKFRYAADAIASVTGAPPGEASVSSRALQRALGEAHDRAQARDYLRRQARRAAARRLRGRGTALESVAGRVESLRLEAIARFRALLAQAPADR